MSIVSYDAFLTEILPYVADVPEPQALVAIRNACIDLCRDTHVLQREMVPFHTVAGVHSYELDVPAGYVVAKLLSLECVGQTLTPRSRLDLTRVHGPHWRELHGQPRDYVQFRMSEVTLVPGPAESGQLITGFVAVQPSRTSTEVEGELLERHSDAIRAGALARIVATPGQPFSDSGAALAWEVKYRVAAQALRAQLNSGQVAAQLRVRQRGF